MLPHTRTLKDTLEIIDNINVESPTPHELIQQLKKHRILSSGVPVDLGGWGLSLSDLGKICNRLARRCGSSGLILAMHYSQSAVICNHNENSVFWRKYIVNKLVGEQYLIASVTSEKGTGGDIGRSICALEETHENHFHITKLAPTISYGNYADAFLVTCRKSEKSPNTDQTIILVNSSQIELQQTNNWDPFGMKKTCSPAFIVKANIPKKQVFSQQFSIILRKTMTPFSHFLWAAVWYGIANNSINKAKLYIREQSRTSANKINAQKLSDLSTIICRYDTYWNNWIEQANFEGASNENKSIEHTHKMNYIKLSASKNSIDLVMEASKILGVAGYMNKSPFSIGENIQDILSSQFMISNYKIQETNAELVKLIK